MSLGNGAQTAGQCGLFSGCKQLNILRDNFSGIPVASANNSERNIKFGMREGCKRSWI